MKKLSSFWNRNDSYFRAGAGMCIYNDEGQVLVFERHFNPGAWQFPQGGRDKGEIFEQTLWRELREETNLVQEDFESTVPFPHLLSYEYGDDIRKLDWVGQTHQWYFLKIKSGIVINLPDAPEPEFKSFKWVNPEKAVSAIHPVKKPIYEMLLRYFKEHIQQ